MKERRATCACGQLEVTCRGEPELVSRCHCMACQRRTGAPFGIAAFFDARNVAVTGETNVFRRISDSGFGIAFHFCPDCGSNVLWQPERKPGMWAVASGAFADPGFPAPTEDSFAETRHPWVGLVKP